MIDTLKIIFTALALLVASAHCQTTQPTADNSRLVMAWTPSLGGDQTKLGLDPLLIKDGWGAWVNKNVLPEYHWIRSDSPKQARFLIHMPFGRDQNGGQYYASEFFNCQKLAPRVVNKAEFVAAWKPLIDAGCEVVCYVGYFDEDPYFVALWNTDRGQWLIKVAETFELPLAARMSIAVDASSRASAGTPARAVMDLLDSMGATTYTETATKAVASDHYIVMSDFYESYVRDNDLPATGEVLVWCAVGNPWTRSFFDAQVKKYQDEGRTVIVPAGWLREGLPGRGSYE